MNKALQEDTRSHAAYSVEESNPSEYERGHSTVAARKEGEHRAVEFKLAVLEEEVKNDDYAMKVAVRSRSTMRTVEQ